MKNLVPVFFRPEMVVANGGSYSPSAGKPALVVADWQARALAVEVLGFEPVDAATLMLAHSERFVRGVFDGSVINGFGSKRADIAESLRHTNGAMLAAARHALATRRFACAPVSGFHHAGFDQAEGFCTFNGLMVTAIALQREGAVRRVGILDLDHHYGNGTDAICRQLRIDWVTHHTSGRFAPTATDAEPYLRRLATVVSQFHDCGLLLYQAGADAHVDDPLGGWMTTEQLSRRDRIVFETAAKIGLPVAWNLAGGYQKDADGSIPAVLEVHRNTLLACAEVLGQFVDEEV